MFFFHLLFNQIIYYVTVILSYVSYKLNAYFHYKKTIKKVTKISLKNRKGRTKRIFIDKSYFWLIYVKFKTYKES